MMEGEVLVAHPQTVQKGGVEVVDMDLVLRGEVTELVGGTVNEARSYSPSRQPHGEAMRVVVPASSLPAALGHGGAAEFSPPDDEGIVQQTPLAQVREEGGNGLVDGLAAGGVLLADGSMGIPALVVELDEAHPSFGQFAGEQAVVGEGGFAGLGAVELAHGFRFAGDVS